MRYFILLFASICSAQVTVTHSGGNWTIAGPKNTAILSESNFALSVRAGAVTWNLVPSAANDVLVKSGGADRPLRLTAARDIRIEPFTTGYNKGIKIALGGWSGADGVRLVLTLCLEGPDDDLVAEAVAIEGGSATVRELAWPKEPNGSQVDYTVIPSDDGTLLPRDWPKYYHPIHRSAEDHSIIQSHLIETWGMSWWGFQRADSAMMVIVETPDDAAYTFSHPAGGPTAMGPLWRAQLGHFAYPRTLRMVFLPRGNYVQMAKRYRRYVMDSGLYVSLKDKIAHNPKVANLIGTPVAGVRVLTNYLKGGARWDAKNPANNYRLTTFAEDIQRLRDWKKQGFEHLNVSMAGWLNQGYDRQTPDALPPAEAAGGWAGMKAFFDTCKELGYTCWLHDQYRDYYQDAPSWNPDFAIHEETSIGQPNTFPGTRFAKDWKDGYIPLMDHWDGGTQGYLNNRYMLGHVVKNYLEMFAHGIHPDGSYQDVFGYIPPDQDFNPDHPATRSDSMRDRAAVMRWVKNNLGNVGTEDGSDWVIPYADYLTSRMNRSASTGTDPDHQDAIPIPLYELVYHDAVVTTYSPADLRGLLHASSPEFRGGANVDAVKRMAELHKRVGLLEMTNHEFLDKDRRRERTTFAGGTTVTVDWDKKTAEVRP
jgi:hypothetical protein